MDLDTFIRCLSSVLFVAIKMRAYLALLSSQEGKQELMIVQLDIVVLRIPPVDLSFNLVSIVIKDEKVRAKTSSEHCTDLLDRLPLARSIEGD